MTEQEAIRRVKKLFKLYVEDEPHSEHYLYADAVKMSEEALEKQIPNDIQYRILKNQMAIMMALRVIVPNETVKGMLDDNISPTANLLQEISENNE